MLVHGKPFLPSFALGQWSDQPWFHWSTKGQFNQAQIFFDPCVAFNWAHIHKGYRFSKKCTIYRFSITYLIGYDYEYWSYASCLFLNIVLCHLSKHTRKNSHTHAHTNIHSIFVRLPSQTADHPLVWYLLPKTAFFQNGRSKSLKNILVMNL